MKFRVVIEQDEDGKFVASCPTLPGCVSDGETRAEAVTNITDAIEGYLTSVMNSGDPILGPVSEEIVDVNLSRIEEAARMASVPLISSREVRHSKKSAMKSTTKPVVTSSCDGPYRRTCISQSRIAESCREARFADSFAMPG